MNTPARYVYLDNAATTGVSTPCLLYTSLRLEVLMFYCYHMFFFYLSEFLTDAKHFDLVARLEQYFGDSWITERVEFADKVYQRWYGGAER